jgi:hypothetical protein
MQNKLLKLFLKYILLKQSIQGFIVTNTRNPPGSVVNIIKCVCVCLTVHHTCNLAYAYHTLLESKQGTWICCFALISWILPVHNGIFRQHWTRPKSLSMTRIWCKYYNFVVLCTGQNCVQNTVLSGTQHHSSKGQVPFGLRTVLDACIYKAAD